MRKINFADLHSQGIERELIHLTGLGEICRNAQQLLHNLLERHFGNSQKGMDNASRGRRNILIQNVSLNVFFSPVIGI